MDESIAVVSQPTSFTDSESLAVRTTYWLFAVLLAIGFFVCVSCYWVPAHAGTDQNGYLFGGKLVSRTLTMQFVPIRPGTTEFDPHQFVGQMWVGADEGTPAERYYPKYPIGLPLLYAIALWIGALLKSDTSVALVYWINPVSMSLAVLGCFMLARRFAGSFLGFLAAITFATSPVTLGLATNPNSHATAVCCVTWGMYLLFVYWDRAGLLRGLAAGLLLGYAATIRYSEGTLILPITLVACFTFRDRNWKSTLSLLGGWAIPVLLLVVYNHFAIGSTTGYGPTNESTGFNLKYAADNWETMFRQLNTNGLSLLLPLSLAGLIWMFWWNWRIAAVLSAWVTPCMLIYMFYYWAPDGTTIGYLRFFLTILPALSLSFFWFVRRLNEIAARYPATHRLERWSIPLTVAAMLIAIPVIWMSAMYLWLGDFSPSTIGLHDNRFFHWLTPNDADVEMGALRNARVAFGVTLSWAVCGACGAGLVMLNLLRGRSALPIIGAGLLSGLVVSMHLTNALPAQEQDQLTRIALLSNVDEIKSTVPDHSVIFCVDKSVLNDLQFKGDYDLYGDETFRRDYVQSQHWLPGQGLAKAPDQPQGLDPGRREALYNRLKDYDQNELDDQLRRIVVDAIANHRRVFVLLPRRDLQAQLRREAVRPTNTGRPSIVTAQMYRRNFSKQLPDLVQRLVSGNRLDFDVAATWITYVPRVVVASNSPRGLRLITTDQPQARRGMELLELVTPTS